MALIFRKHEGATFKVHAYPGRDQKILRKPREIPPSREGEGPSLVLSGRDGVTRAEMNPPPPHIPTSCSTYSAQQAVVIFALVASPPGHREKERERERHRRLSMKTITVEEEVSYDGTEIPVSLVLFFRSTLLHVALLKIP